MITWSFNFIIWRVSFLKDSLNYVWVKTSTNFKASDAKMFFWKFYNLCQSFVTKFRIITVIPNRYSVHSCFHCKYEGLIDSKNHISSSLFCWGERQIISKSNLTGFLVRLVFLPLKVPHIKRKMVLALKEHNTFAVFSLIRTVFWRSATPLYIIVGREFLTPYFMKTPLFQILSKPSFPVAFNLHPTALFVVFFLWLNGWSCHVWLVIVLNIMNLQMSGLGTLVPEGPCCVVYATKHQKFTEVRHIM